MPLAEDAKPLSHTELLQTPIDTRLYIERKDWVRLRVEEEHWDDSSPLNGKAPPTGELPPGANGEANPAAAVVPGKPPYSLVVRILSTHWSFAYLLIILAFLSARWRRMGRACWTGGTRTRRSEVGDVRSTPIFVLMQKSSSCRYIGKL